MSAAEEGRHDERIEYLRTTMGGGEDIVRSAPIHSKMLLAGQKVLQSRPSAARRGTHARASTFTLLEPLQGSFDFFIECSAAGDGLLRELKCWVTGDAVGVQKDS